MSRISELTSQADYIAKKSNRLTTQWQTYRNTLTKAVTTKKNKINHKFTFGKDKDLRFVLFNHFTVSIALSEGFYSRDICYRINLAMAHEAENFVPFAHATLDENGNIDDVINNRDMQAVFEHYLDKIAIIYQCLFDSLHDGHAIRDALKKLTLAV
ncbi:formate hydrogenlyase regulator HycA [Serratia sp. 1D1416]|uniref:formate hydrogenlyase regulator HycA n=1 Tax=Serratia sp. 1D1416 TaxID=2447890 RepID=UPI001013C69F|nr:formate hydrogenlyase regulator HycA [Serratia sp. 1D1416]